MPENFIEKCAKCNYDLDTIKNCITIFTEEPTEQNAQRIVDFLEEFDKSVEDMKIEIVSIIKNAELVEEKETPEQHTKAVQEENDGKKDEEELTVEATDNGFKIIAKKGEKND